MNALWQDLQPHLVFWLALAWTMYLAGLAGWIVLQKREPVATLSWIMSLALLPGLGLLIYHLLGPQRIRRQRLRRILARARVEQVALGPNLAEESSALMRLAQGSCGYPPSSSERVQLLVNGAATFDALVAAIALARHHVHLEYYIFEPDVTGTRVRDALVERARAGVKVRLLLDALGSARASWKFMEPLLAAGGEVAFFHRFRLRRLWRPRLNLRSHRKIVVIDGNVGFSGGINISDTENELLRDDAFHDLHFRVDGAAVRWLQLAFAEDWVYATGRAAREATRWPQLQHGGIRTQVLPAGPDSPWEPIHRVLLAAIGQARQRVWLATPYFVPGEAARMALTSAALRGVEVRLLVPRRSDSALVSAAARSYFDELIGAGVRVFEYPRMLHTKALLVDADTCVLGSSNFDNRSFRLNFELCVLFEDAGVGADLEAVLARDLAAASEVRGQRRLPFWPRLAEASARLLSPLL
jgi:cardiolipin synthase